MCGRSLSIALLIWAALGALPDSAVAGRGEPWIRLETWACYGTCPVYVVSVSRDGQVSYQGKEFVLQTGARRRSLRIAELTRLQKAVEESGFWGLSEKCCDCRDVTDNPWTVVEVVKDGATKKIAHYDGCQSAPRTVPELAVTIVSLTGAIKWIGTHEQRFRHKWPRRC